MQRWEQEIQPLPELQGQQHKFEPSAGEKRDKEVARQPWMLKTKSIDFDSQTMRTANPAARHQPFVGDYALEASTSKKSEPASQYTLRTSADAKEQLLNPEKPRGPYMAAGCAKIAEFLAHAPWEEQREGLIRT